MKITLLCKDLGISTLSKRSNRLIFLVIGLLINWVTLHLVPWHLLLVGTWLHGHHGVPCRDHLFAFTCLQASIDRQACLTKYIVLAILNVDDITRWQGVSFEIM